MHFHERAGHGEMSLTFADGLSVFVRVVQVQMRFGPVHGGPHLERTDARRAQSHSVTSP